MDNDIPIIKDIIQTRDDDGNEVNVYPETSDDQVVGLEHYVKNVYFDNGNFVITNGDGTTYRFYLGQGLDRAVVALSNVDHTITVINSDETTYDLEIDNELISNDEILNLFDILDSRDIYY